METNANEPSVVKHLVDEDPTTGTYTDITSQGVDAPNRTQGTNLVDTWYYARKPAGRRCSLDITWPTDNAAFKLYSIDIASKDARLAGGR